MITQPATDVAAIDLTGVVKSFKGPDGGRFRAVDGLDLRVERGEIVALLGPNGAGKTTTLDIVLGLIDADEGRASVLGQPPRRSVLDGRVAAVLQSGGLLRDLTVRETTELIASTFDRPRPVAEVLERAGLGGLADRRVSKCSGGEQQRLRFALALLPDPDLLILDEPTAGMDVTARRDFWRTMRADADSGRTIVFATHYLEEADAFARRIVMVAGGRVVADGSTEEIRSQHSGRTLSVDVPDPVEPWLEAVRALPGVREVVVDAGRATVRAEDTDAVALSVLRDLGGRNVEIRSADLESAFLAIAESEGSPVVDERSR